MGRVTRLHSLACGRLALFGGLLLHCAVAVADPAGSPSTPSAPRSFTERGERAEPSGPEVPRVTLGLVSKADVLSKLRGGLCREVLARYRGHVDLVVALDTGRLGLWRGGRVVLVAQNGHGEGLSAGHLGDVQTLSNIDAHSFTQMSEWFLEQTLLDERLRVKVGRQDAAVDFGLVDFGAEFLNSSFGVIPTNPLPTFPNPGLGVSAFAAITDQVSVGVGVYSATPLEWGIPRGTTLGVEVDYSLRSSLAEPGSRYRIGLWHRRASLHGEDSGTISVYAAVDQVLFREGGGQGLSGFLQVGKSSGAPNGVSDYVGAGVIYTGLFPGRDEDRLGLGVAHARLPPSAGRGPAETDIELLYSVSPCRWLALQPSVHWLIRPGGQGPNAIVAGFRVETSF